MAGFLNYLPSKLNAIWIVLTAVWFIIHVCFINLYGNTILQSDMWRHAATILIPFVNGDAGWSVLFENHHAIPLIHLHQLTNYFVFGGNFKLDAFLGMTIWFLIAVLFFRRFCKRFEATDNRKVFYAGAALLINTIIFMGLGSQYTLPLVAVQSYFFIVGFILIWLTKNYIEGGNGHYKAVAMIILTAVISLLFNENYGSLFVLASAGVLFIGFLHERQPRLFILGSLLLLIVIIYKLTLLSLTDELKPASSAASILNYANLSFVKYLLQTAGQGVANGFIGVSPSAKTGLFGWVYVALGGLFFAFSAIYILRRKSDKLISALLIFVILVILSVGVFRWWAPDGFVAARYVFTHKLAAICLIWAGCEAVIRQTDKPRLGPIFCLVAISLVFYQILVSLSAFSKAKGKLYVQQDLEIAITMLGTDSSNQFEPLGLVAVAHKSEKAKGDAYVNGVIPFLAKHQLNLFSSKYKHRDVISQYRIAYDVFRMAENPSPILPRKTGECFTVDANNDQKFWSLSVKSKKPRRYIEVKNRNTKSSIKYPVYRGLMTHYGIFAADVEYDICIPEGLVQADFQKL